VNFLYQTDLKLSLKSESACSGHSGRFSNFNYSRNLANVVKKEESTCSEYPEQPQNVTNFEQSTFSGYSALPPSSATYLDHPSSVTTFEQAAYTGYPVPPVSASYPRQ
jgi:hypothetical protein